MDASIASYKLQYRAIIFFREKELTMAMLYILEASFDEWLDMSSFLSWL